MLIHGFKIWHNDLVGTVRIFAKPAAPEQFDNLEGSAQTLYPPTTLSQLLSNHRNLIIAQVRPPVCFGPQCGDVFHMNHLNLLYKQICANLKQHYPSSISSTTIHLLHRLQITVNTRFSTSKPRILLVLLCSFFFSYFLLRFYLADGRIAEFVTFTAMKSKLISSLTTWCTRSMRIEGTDTLRRRADEYACYLIFICSKYKRAHATVMAPS